MDTVDVATFDSEGEAQVVKARLEEAGIPCMLVGTGQSGLSSGFFSAGATSIRLRVPSEDADEARAMIEGEESEPDAS
jgi:hypothetical protein